MLGKRGECEADDTGKTEGSAERESAEHCKKKKGTVSGEEDNKPRDDGGTEATEPGALGQLVGAMDGTHQEP